MKTINDTIAALKRVDKNLTSLDMLLEFEKTLDNASLYAYRNWMAGELVDGPHINRYLFEVTLMYPHALMPDPAGGMRLIKYGCKVYYKEDTFREPVRVFDTDDIQPSKTQAKKAKIKEHPVWLVTIKMPRKFVDEAQEGILRIGDQEVDVEDIAAAYDEDLGDAGTKEADVDADADAREQDFGGEEL